MKSCSKNFISKYRLNLNVFINYSSEFKESWQPYATVIKKGNFNVITFLCISKRTDGFKPDREILKGNFIKLICFTSLNEKSLFKL